MERVYLRALGICTHGRIIIKLLLQKTTYSWDRTTFVQDEFEWWASGSTIDVAPDSIKTVNLLTG
jgi:hypothetical protein